MAEDRKDAPPAARDSRPPGAISNRDRKREAPIIDAKPAEVVDVTPAETVVSDTAPAQDEVAKAEAAAPAADAADAVAAGVARPIDAEPQGEAGSAKTDAANAGAEPAKPEETATIPQPASAVGEPATRKRSGGLLAGLLGGVAGAVLALGGGYAWVGGKLNSAQQTHAIAAKAGADASAAVAAAEQRFKAEIDRQAAAIAGLGKQVAAGEAQTKKLEAELAAVRDAAAKAPSAPPAPVAAPVDLGPIEAGLGDLEKRLAAIETSLSAPKTPVRASDPDVKPPAGAPAPATPAPSVAPIVPPALLGEVAALAQRLKALESRPQTPPVDLAPLQQRLAEIEKRVEPLAGRIAPLEQKIAPLEQKIAPLEDKIAPLAAAAAQNKDALGSQQKEIATNKARADAAALAVASRSLADAVASGAPFGPLLKAAQTLGGDAEAIKRLQPVADKGVPTAAALVSQFEPLATAMVEAENKPAPNASFTERLAASAGKLVRVRPADDTTDDTTPALAMRIGTALRSGRSSEALALFDKLPAPAREKASGWAASLRARIGADEAARTILNGALARLAQP